MYHISQNTTHPSINILLLRVEPFLRHFAGQESELVLSAKA